MQRRGDVRDVRIVMQNRGRPGPRGGGFAVIVEWLLDLLVSDGSESQLQNVQLGASAASRTEERLAVAAAAASVHNSRPDEGQAITQKQEKTTPPFCIRSVVLLQRAIAWISLSFASPWQVSHFMPFDAVLVVFHPTSMFS